MNIEKICIVGAGAIGGFLGTRLALHTNAKVSALARGDTLAALQKNGWRMQTAAGLEQAPLHQASSDAQALGAQDLIIVALKAYALPQAAKQIQALLHPGSIVLPAMNGVPWWFCSDLPAFANRPLQSIDPGGVIAACIPVSQVLGCVVHASTWVSEPGLVQHKMGQGLIVGEPGGAPRGGLSERVQAVAQLLRQAKFDVTQSEHVRRDIWYKLWGNMTMNPISAITGATVDRILSDPQLRGFCSAVMHEAAEIGQQIDCPIEQKPEDRHAITQKLGAFKTSMLQDAEAGRPLELDALVTAAHEIAQHLKIATPNIDALLGMARVFAQSRGLYPQP